MKYWVYLFVVAGRGVVVRPRERVCTPVPVLDVLSCVQRCEPIIGLASFLGCPRRWTRWRALCERCCLLSENSCCGKDLGELLTEPRLTCARWSVREGFFVVQVTHPADESLAGCVTIGSPIELD